MSNAHTELAFLRSECRRALDPQRVGRYRTERIVRYIKALEALVADAHPSLGVARDWTRR